METFRYVTVTLWLWCCCNFWNQQEAKLRIALHLTVHASSFDMIGSLIFSQTMTGQTWIDMRKTVVYYCVFIFSEVFCLLRVFSMYSIVSLQILGMKIHESRRFAQFPSRTVFAKGLIILCTGVLPCTCSLACPPLLSIQSFCFFWLICPHLSRSGPKAFVTASSRRRVRDQCWRSFSRISTT